MPWKDPEKRRAYHRKYQLERYHRVRREFFSDKKCKHCNSEESLELHHRDPSQKITHKIWTWTESRRLEELEKCDILCEDCHKKETSKQRATELIHGTPYAYRNRAHACRCDLCRRAHAEYMQEYRVSR